LMTTKTTTTPAKSEPIPEPAPDPTAPLTFVCRAANVSGHSGSLNAEVKLACPLADGHALYQHSYGDAEARHRQGAVERCQADGVIAVYLHTKRPWRRREHLVVASGAGAEC
jgi:hypothetical protein